MSPSAAADGGGLFVVEEEAEAPDGAALEPTLDRESAPSMGPVQPGVSPPSRYWHAQALADLLQQEFVAAQAAGQPGPMRERFHTAAAYYTRTLRILRSAVSAAREPLVQATLHNLIVLHRVLLFMHRAAPEVVPTPRSLDRQARERLIEGAVVQVLEADRRAISSAEVERRALQLVPLARPALVRRALEGLSTTGHVESTPTGWTRTARAYRAVDLDRLGVPLLLGQSLAATLEHAGFYGLADIDARSSDFRALWQLHTRFGPDTAALVVAAAGELRLDQDAGATPWTHADLLRSPYPRPYQYAAYSIFRGYGYTGQVIESPTGSGKTMIGMLCIQDWLRSLSRGQAILVLVPTVNYQQQWVGELCYKPIGLRLSPHAVFAGAPSAVEAARAKGQSEPCVIITTYAALSQAGSGVGKGGFDRDAIETFLQGNAIQYVVLDEVHKVVDDLQGVSADVTRLLTEWLRDGSLRGAIGFSGTAAAFRSRFEQLGLQLVHVMPAAELIAYGFVAPFAEASVPFAYSDRERRIRDLLERYKELLRTFVRLVGAHRLRRWFAELPFEQRLSLADELRATADARLASRVRSWEQGGELSLLELPLVSIVQLARGWSDADLVSAARQDGAADVSGYGSLRQELAAIREVLAELVAGAETRRRLLVEGFGTTLLAPLDQTRQMRSRAARAAALRDALATTCAGLYAVLSDWYLRVGEGRVDTIKAIIEAERAARAISGVIVFDTGAPMRWRAGVAVPGYAGVAGVFGQLLGDAWLRPIAVLSSEMYLPFDPADPLPRRIGEYIQRRLVGGELADAFFELASQGLALSAHDATRVRATLEELLLRWWANLGALRSARRGEFGREVLAPLRRFAQQELSRSARVPLGQRLRLRNPHLRSLIDTLFDYALIAQTLASARVADLQQANGARQKFYRVLMPTGDRKQLMYDLTARIVDAEEVGVNVVIVSPWARTGWNVTRPNLLIDATATRDRTSWQQLRGRAMRALGTWDNDCYRLVLLLLGEQAVITDATNDQYDESDEDAAPAPAASAVVEERLWGVLRVAHRHAPPGTGEDGAAITSALEQRSMDQLSPSQRRQLAVELMLARNKVTHVYELLKAYGSAAQVRFDRVRDEWSRAEAVAQKHVLEYAVNPLTGWYGAGVEHAPLLFSRDPRRDVPDELRAHLQRSLLGADPRIVRGWLAVLGVRAEET